METDQRRKFNLIIVPQQFGYVLKLELIPGTGNGDAKHDEMAETMVLRSVNELWNEHIVNEAHDDVSIVDRLTALFSNQHGRMVKDRIAEILVRRK